MTDNITYLLDWRRDRAIKNLTKATYQAKLMGGKDELVTKLLKLINEMRKGA